MTNQSAAAFGGWFQFARVGTLAGLITALVMLIPIMILQEIRSVGFALEFQLTASGLLGANAYASVAFPVIVGICLHLLVSIVPAVIYALAAWRVPLVNRWFWVSGPVFGLLVFFFMGLVVLPLSPMSPPSPQVPLPFVAGLFIHMFGYGLPISFLVHRFTSDRLQVAGQAT